MWAVLGLSGSFPFSTLISMAVKLPFLLPTYGKMAGMAVFSLILSVGIRPSVLLLFCSLSVGWGGWIFHLPLEETDHAENRWTDKKIPA